jgi:hypothetical protein
MDGQYQVLVKWLGLEAEESSWEPAENLADDIPAVLRKWIQVNRGAMDMVDAMAKVLSKTHGFSL